MPPPPSPDTLLTDRRGVERVLGRCGVDVRLDADRTTVVSAEEEEQLTFSCDYGTEFVYNRIGARYALAQLANSTEVYWWASAVAAHLLCFYRLGVIPATLQWEFERVAGPNGDGSSAGLLADVATGKYRPFSMQSRSGTGVSMDNMRLDGRFPYKQLRVETTLSDGSRVQASPQFREIASQYIVEFNR